MGANEDEHAAWIAALDGDSNAFVAIFDLHRDRVYRHALRLTANVHDAEDVTAGAFLELWRRRMSVRVVDQTVLPWLLVTTTNVARNQARALRRYRTLIDALPRVEVSRSAEDEVLERVVARRTVARVREALSELSPADASLISLTAFEDFSPAQVAQVLGISATAARTRLHRARARMATELAEAGIEDKEFSSRETSR